MSQYVWTDVNGRMIVAGDMVKSYDFITTDSSYVIGTILERGPVDFLSHGTDYLHIRIFADALIVNGEERRTFERMGEICYVACVEPHLGGARVEFREVAFEEEDDSSSLTVQSIVDYHNEE